MAATGWAMPLVLTQSAAAWAFRSPALAWSMTTFCVAPVNASGTVVHGERVGALRLLDHLVPARRRAGVDVDRVVALGDEIDRVLDLLRLVTAGVDVREADVGLVGLGRLLHPRPQRIVDLVVLEAGPAFLLTAQVVERAEVAGHLLLRGRHLAGHPDQRHRATRDRAVAQQLAPAETGGVQSTRQSARLELDAVVALHISRIPSSVLRKVHPALRRRVARCGYVQHQPRHRSVHYRRAILAAPPHAWPRGADGARAVRGPADPDRRPRSGLLL